MSDTDGRRGFVDVLSAGTAGSIGVDADIVRVDFHVDGFVDVRHDLARDKTRLPLGLRVEWRNPHEPVDAALRFEISVGILAVNLEIDVFDAGLIALHHVDCLHGESVLVRPLAVHPVQHRAPVAGFRPAGARVQRQNRVAVIIWPCQESCEPHLLELFFKIIEFAADIRHNRRIVLLVSHLDQVQNVLIRFCETVRLVHRLLQILELLHLIIGSVGIIPEVRCLGLPG